MQGYAADLEEMAARPSRDDKNELLRYATNLRRYGWAVKIIALQNDPIEGQSFPALGSHELAEAAHRYNLRLPGESHDQ